MKTADLCDAHDAAVRVAEPIWHDYGGVLEFGGPVHCLRIADDNSLVRSALEEPGEGRVLIVDNAGSVRCAVVGGNLAKLGEANGWAGIVVHGCVRDREEIAACRIGVKALATHPRADESLRERVYGEVHMLQHGACARETKLRRRLGRCRERLDAVWRDTLGFAGVEIHRRTIGLARIVEYESIEDVASRVRLQGQGLRFGRELVLEAESIDGIDELLGRMRAFGAPGSIGVYGDRA